MNADSKPTRLPRAIGSITVMYRLISPALTILALSALGGCSWVPWIEQDKGPVRHGVISVCLNQTPAKGKRGTYAMASAHHGRKLKDAGFKRLGADGSASFVVPMGQLYDIRIFYDLNRNQSHDANEPSGLVQNVAPAPLTTSDTGVLTMAFGVVGPVAGRPRPQSSPAEPAASPPSRTIPPEAGPYLKYVPQWMQDKLLQ